jgi:hypothetical protein
VGLPGPGRYQLRVAAHSQSANERGSIYVDVDVPDYDADRLSMSGIVVSALPGPPTSRPGAVTQLTRRPPTAVRSFGSADLVMLFAQLYQGGRAGLAPVELTTTIRDAADRTVSETRDTIAADRFGADRSAAWEQRLPLADLRAGEYLCTIEARLGKTVVKRTMPFVVR